MNRTLELIRAALERGDTHILSGGTQSEQECGPSIQACLARFAQLDADGAPLAGSKNLYVISSMIKFDASPVINAGDDIQIKNACGELCTAYKAPDVIARWDVNLELCAPDPELFKLLTGGTLYVDAGVTVGYQAPALKEASNPDGVSLELWTKTIVGEDVAGYRWWAWPRIKFTFGGPRNFENAAMQNLFTGQATENANWLDGPANDWLRDSSKVFQWQDATSDDLPEATCGAIALNAS